MKSFKMVIPAPKKRDFSLVEMRKRKSGAHEKPYKSSRSKDKAKLKKEW